MCLNKNKHMILENMQTKWTCDGCPTPQHAQCPNLNHVLADEGKGKGRKGKGDKVKSKGGKALDYAGVDAGAEAKDAALPAAQAGGED